MHQKPRTISLSSAFHRYWHTSGPPPSTFFSPKLQKNKGHCFSVLDLATSRFKQPRRVVQLYNSQHLGDPCGCNNQGRRFITQIKSTNQNTASQRLVEKPHVGGSSERAKQDEKKPEFRFKIRPIRTKLRAENAENSLRRRIIADIFQTAHH